MAKIKPEFDRRDVKIIGLSVEAYPSATAFDGANAQMLTELQAASHVALNSAQQVLSRTEVWSAILAALAVLLALLGAFGTIRGITKPLRSLTSTLRRLSAGDHAARAVLAGSLEAREVAQSVNTLADETDRLRAAEEEHARLSVMAREMGFRIREHLHADDVLRVLDDARRHEARQVVHVAVGVVVGQAVAQPQPDGDEVVELAGALQPVDHHRRGRLRQPVAPLFDEVQRQPQQQHEQPHLHGVPRNRGRRRIPRRVDAKVGIPA